MFSPGIRVDGRRADVLHNDCGIGERVRKLKVKG